MGEGVRLLKWAGVAALCAPAAILLHELGHFAVAKAFGFPGVVLRYASVSNQAAELGFPAWQQGLQAAAGPMVTFAIVLGSCIAVSRFGARPATVAPAIAAGIRPLTIGVAYLVVRVLHPSQVRSGNFDELNVARDLGLSPEAVVGASVLMLLAMWVYVARLMRSGTRWRELTAVVAGTLLGVALYAGWIGPLILP